MKIAIVGVGHMGSWLARSLASSHEVGAFDTNLERVANLKDVICFQQMQQLAEFSPELVVNVVSLHRTVEVFRQLDKLLKPECAFGDMASVKDGIPACYGELGRRFISIHPMFGPTYVNLEAPVGENAIIIEESDAELKRFFYELFATCGLRTFEFSFAEHDRLMAHSLTTPFVASLVFAACIDNRTVPGSTYARHKEIAKKLLANDDHLLAEILFNTESVPQLERITGKLEFLKHVIRAKDREELVKFFEAIRKSID